MFGSQHVTRCSHSAYGSSPAFHRSGAYVLPVRGPDQFGRGHRGHQPVPSRPVVKVGDDARPAQLTTIAANLPCEPVSDHHGEQFPLAGVLAAGAGDLRPACKAFNWQFVVGRA